MNDYHFSHIDLFNAFASSRGLIRAGDHEVASAYLSLLATVLVMPAVMMGERFQDFLKGFDAL